MGSNDSTTRSNRQSASATDAPDNPTWRKLLDVYAAGGAEPPPRAAVAASMMTLDQTKDDYRWAYAKLEGHRKENHRLRTLLAASNKDGFSMLSEAIRGALAETDRLKTLLREAKILMNHRTDHGAEATAPEESWYDKIAKEDLDDG